MSTIITADEHVALTPAQVALQDARATIIDSPQMLTLVQTEAKACIDRAAALEEERMTMTRPLDEAKKRIIEKYSAPIIMLRAAADHYKQAMLTWNRREAERAAAERQRIEQEQRKARQAAEAEAAKIAAKAQEDAQKLAEQAEAARQAGNAAKAAALEQKAEAVTENAEAKLAVLQTTATALSVAATTPPAAIAKGGRKVYEAEVVDKARFVGWIVANNPSLLAIVEIDQSALNKQASALKEAFSFPGCRLVVSERMTLR
jgi:uncharacterized membrane protein YqiK